MVLLFVSLITIVIESRLIPYLKVRASQPIYDEGPSWHLSKKGTPTMGGMAFIISSFVVLIICAIIHLKSPTKFSISIIISLIFCLVNALIGIIDDITKLKRKNNAGLTPKQKLFFQLIFAILFIMARKHFLFDSTIIELSFFKVDLGLFYYPIVIVLILGIVNCANLTDGIDGLASTVALSIGVVFLLIGSHIADASVLSALLVGVSLGFLIFNTSPAKIFMGDTGSLFLGALVVSVAFALGKPIILILVGMVYVIEGLSVILQVLIYKATKKRLFKMAPLHHHLEKSGISEPQICALAIAVTIISSAFLLLIL